MKLLIGHVSQSWTNGWVARLLKDRPQLQIIPVAGCELHTVKIPGGVDVACDGLGQGSGFGVLQRGRVEVCQAHAQGHPDELRIQRRYGFGGGDRAEGAAYQRSRRRAAIEPFQRHCARHNGRVEDLVLVVFCDVGKVQGQSGVLAETRQYFEQASQQA